MMNINWQPSEEKFVRMEALFAEVGQEALAWNHYDFNKAFDIYTPQEWKEFLQDQRVANYITTEFEAIQDSELRKLVLNINNSNSVGKAQIINSLAKLLERDTGIKSGPAFIYTYVPLTEEQMSAENVEVLDNDPFITNPTTLPTRGRTEIINPR